MVRHMVRSSEDMARSPMGIVLERWRRQRKKVGRGAGAWLPTIGPEMWLGLDGEARSLFDNPLNQSDAGDGGSVGFPQAQNARPGAPPSCAGQRRNHMSEPFAPYSWPQSRQCST
jgi:hypothetical protein